MVGERSLARVLCRMQKRGAGVDEIATFDAACRDEAGGAGGCKAVLHKLAIFFALQDILAGEGWVGLLDADEVSQVRLGRELPAAGLCASSSLRQPRMLKRTSAPGPCAPFGSFGTTLG